MSQIETPADTLRDPAVRLQVRDLLIWMAIAAAALSRNQQMLMKPSLSRQIEGGLIFLIYSGAIAGFVSLVIARWKSPSLQLMGGHALAILRTFSSFTYLYILPDFPYKGEVWSWTFLGVRLCFGSFFLFSLGCAVLAVFLLIRCRLTWAWRIVIGLEAASLVLWAVLMHSEIMTEFATGGVDHPWHTTMLKVFASISSGHYWLTWCVGIAAVLIDLWNQRYGDWVHCMGIIAFFAPVFSMIVIAIIG